MFYEKLTNHLRNFINEKLLLIQVKLSKSAFKHFLFLYILDCFGEPTNT